MGPTHGDPDGLIRDGWCDTWPGTWHPAGPPLSKLHVWCKKPTSLLWEKISIFLTHDHSLITVCQSTQIIKRPLAARAAVKLRCGDQLMFPASGKSSGRTDPAPSVRNTGSAKYQDHSPPPVKEMWSLSPSAESVNWNRRQERAFCKSTLVSLHCFS